jgi:hypothetical protein
VVYHCAHEEAISTHILDQQHLQDIRQRFPFWKDADQFNIYHT